MKFVFIKQCKGSVRSRLLRSQRLARAGGRPHTAPGLSLPLRSLFLPCVPGSLFLGSIFVLSLGLTFIICPVCHKAPPKGHVPPWEVCAPILDSSADKQVTGSSREPRSRPGDLP